MNRLLFLCDGYKEAKMLQVHDVPLQYCDQAYQSRITQKCFYTPVNKSDPKLGVNKD
jgi:hypothetical protein